MNYPMKSGSSGHVVRLLCGLALVLTTSFAALAAQTPEGPPAPGPEPVATPVTLATAPVPAGAAAAPAAAAPAADGAASGAGGFSDMSASTPTPNADRVRAAVGFDRYCAGRQDLDEAELVHSLLDQILLPGEPVHLVGHSYGGMVATGVADRARDRRDLIPMQIQRHAARRPRPKQASRAYALRPLDTFKVTEDYQGLNRRHGELRVDERHRGGP